MKLFHIYICSSSYNFTYYEASLRRNQGCEVFDGKNADVGIKN